MGLGKGKERNHEGAGAGSLAGNLAGAGGLGLGLGFELELELELEKVEKLEAYTVGCFVVFVVLVEGTRAFKCLWSILRPFLLREICTSATKF